jgi:hypothetical protein
MTRTSVPHSRCPTHTPHTHPGAYEGGTDLKKVFTPLSRPDASQAGFCSAQGRFKQTAAGTPGPGSYTPGAITRGASSSLATAQKTYNVTYLGMQ